MCVFLALVPCMGMAAIPTILDTDIGGDIDDLGTLAVLHALANRDAITIAGVMSCTWRSAALGAIDAVNTFYNRPDIPVGRPKRNISYSSEYFYAEYLDKEWPHDQPDPQTAPYAVDLYRKILAEAEDNSVLIVSVGGMCNFYDLVLSEPDTYSKLSGPDLFNKKVLRFVVMGGKYPCENSLCGEANLASANSCYNAASKTVVEKVSAPIIFSGMELGLHGYMTGTRLNELPDDNIVKDGYIFFCKNPPSYMTWLGIPSNSIVKAATFDQSALIGGVWPDSSFFTRVTYGYNLIDDGGRNGWRTDKDHTNESYFKTQMDPATFATSYIEPLMMDDPLPPDQITATAPRRVHSPAATPSLHSRVPTENFTLQGKRITASATSSKAASVYIQRKGAKSAILLKR